MNETDAHELLVKLLRRIAPEVDVAEADRAAPLQEEFDLDSVDFLNLVVALSEETGVDVPDLDYPKLSTVQGFVAYVSDATSG